MTDRKPDQRADELVIEFPDDPHVNDLPDASEAEAASTPDAPPVSHGHRVP